MLKLLGDINVYYGKIHAKEHVSFEVRSRRGGGPDRRQRRRKIHPETRLPA